MRHNTKTVDDAMLAFDWLERHDIAIVRPTDFQPVKFGGRMFGQFEALENKLTTAGVDQVLSDQATLTPVAKPTPVVETLASFFSAMKVSKTDTEVLFQVRIKRGKRTGQQLLDLTGRRHYGPSDVPGTMPLIGGESEGWEEFDFLMYKSGKQTPDSKVEGTRTSRELTRDLEVQILINATFPEFADQRPNGDSWQDENGNWCFASFDRCDGVRRVDVWRSVDVWDDGGWFGGRK